MPKQKYDFSGYVTKNDILCADQRIIKRDAFKQDNGKRVPLIWHHDYDDPGNIIGNVVLENRDDGVYGYGSFNKNPKAISAKEAVTHGDLFAMSIHANRLVQRGNEVVHGIIREVSLVLAGANDGARIEHPVLTHSDDGEPIFDDEDALIYTMIPLDSISHSDDEEDNNEDDSEDINHSDDDSSDDLTHEDSKTMQDVIDSYNKEQLEVINFLIHAIKTGKTKAEDYSALLEHSDDADDSDDGKTIGEVLDTLDEDQQKVLGYLLKEASKSASSDISHSDDNKDKDDEDEDTDDESNDDSDDEDENDESADDEESDDDKKIKHSDEGGNEMKTNVFEQQGNEDMHASLTHDEMKAIFEDATNIGSLKKTILQHGIEDIDILFPEAKTIRPTPDLISRQMDWVSEVWGGTYKSPFARIKSIAADITMEEARAKGYIKGEQKQEEQFGLLTRITTPQTVYKLQKLDRDDIIDITDFDVVAWLKQEMRMMLNEELARAIMVGDGRSNLSKDKIKEDNIRPIYNDADVYTIKYEITYDADADVTDISNALVDGAIRSRKNYRGSGSPAFYGSTEVITDMMLARDKIGHRLYRTRQELADALNVSKIVEVPVMEDITRSADNGNTYDLLGVIVNLKDYTVGADKGGAVSFFDDFDIDFNKYTYLIEARCSGALTKPFSAITLEKLHAAD